MHFLMPSPLVMESSYLGPAPTCYQSIIKLLRSKNHRKWPESSRITFPTGIMLPTYMTNDKWYNPKPKSYHFQTSQMAGWFFHPWAVAASRWDRPTSSWWGSRSYETRWFSWRLIHARCWSIAKSKSTSKQKPFGFFSPSTQCQQVRCKSIFEVEKFKLSSKMTSMQTSIPQHTLRLSPPQFSP